MSRHACCKKKKFPHDKKKRITYHVDEHICYKYIYVEYHIRYQDMRVVRNKKELRIIYIYIYTQNMVNKISRHAYCKRKKKELRIIYICIEYYIRYQDVRVARNKKELRTVYIYT